jgi:membrane protein required for colicin V production
LLGAILGAVKWLLFISLAICAIEFIDSNNQIIEKNTKESSALYYPVRELAGLFMPAVQDFTKDFLNNEQRAEGQEI